ncbi:MAG: hypothetical protein H7320_25275 [Ferruginibacter sp.]|nr:hypothetical protein [Ferruginibacter sp.]
MNFDNSVLKLPIASQVKATIFSDPIKAEWLPKDAILSLGLEKLFFVKTGKGYKAHKVITGITYKNLVQVTAGITPVDSVAANAQFLMDSESFIKVQNKN